MQHKVKIDASNLSYVAVCSCGWRAQAPTRGAIWLKVSKHLKCEGQTVFAKRAAEAARLADSA